jgi:hypothetical protein
MPRKAIKENNLNVNIREACDGVECLYIHNCLIKDCKAVSFILSFFLCFAFIALSCVKINLIKSVVNKLSYITKGRNYYFKSYYLRLLVI